MIVFSLKVRGQDHLIAWDNNKKQPEPGASLMLPADFETWAKGKYPDADWPTILDLVKRKGTSFPNPEKDVDFCLRTYTYILRHGRQGGTLTREEFVEMYGPKTQAKDNEKEEEKSEAKKSEKGKSGKA